MDRGITVAEVTYCNSISVSEHVVMMILALVRNYLPSHQWVVERGWNIADCVARSYDLEGMNVGTVAAGRIPRGYLGERSVAPGLKSGGDGSSLPDRAGGTHKRTQTRERELH